MLMDMGYPGPGSHADERSRSRAAKGLGPRSRVNLIASCIGIDDPKEMMNKKL